MNNNTTERRASERLNIDLPGEVQKLKTGELYPIRFQNISKHGAYFLSTQCVIIGESVQIRLGTGFFLEGTVVRVEGNDVPAAFLTRISPHQLGLSDLLAAAMLTDELPRKLILFGVEPECMDIGLDLTETVEANVEKLVNLVADELRACGCTLVPVAATFTEKARFWDTA